MNICQEQRELMNLDKAAGYLGLAARAGKVMSGEFSAEKAIPQKNVYLLLLSSDASMNTKEHFQRLCSKYNVPVCELFDKETLGHVIGKNYRAAAAVTDQRLAEAIIKVLQTELQ